jgi:hypothetical protein
MKKLSVICILAVCALVDAPLVLLVGGQMESRRVTSQIKRAGGFVGAMQPAPWLNPVYDIVCRIDFCCEPYQLIFDDRSNYDEALPLARDLRYLRILDLYDATLTTHQVELLRDLTQLESIRLHKCVVPEGALDQLKRSLPNIQVTLGESAPHAL